MRVTQGNFRAVRWIPVLMGLLGLLLFLALLGGWIGVKSRDANESRVLSASQLSLWLESSPGAANRLTTGQDIDTATLENLRGQIAQARQRLAAAGIEAGNAGEWQGFDAALGSVIVNGAQARQFAIAGARATTAIEVLTSQIEALQAAGNQSLRGGFEPGLVALGTLRGVLGPGDDGFADGTADRIAAAAAAVAGSITALRNNGAIGSDVAALVGRNFDALDQSLQVMIANAEEAAMAANAAGELAGFASRLRGQIGNSLNQAGVVGGFLARPGVIVALLLSSVLVLACLIAFYFSSANVQRVAEEHARQNQRNQEAILRLLDELGSLADGDLTVQATVTEDITGAIADSINYAIEALRNLVTTIKDSAIMVNAAAKQAEATTGHLAAASETQAQQVGSATESIARLSQSIEEISGNAERGADVARHSVDVAHKGGDAVRRTIEGMNTIRETIQDTSKRIKRLGESSQEIGNIIELINDIAEQTNILALNASIQASMAGEAGRGFAVVADEVQRLAERSANATKQVEVLVRTIQSDTNEAVVSMERSTTDVVGGALLAENAGAALEEIEQVSNQIASLVQNISNSARQQATSAADITRNTGVLREISEQTAESTSATSESISKLAELATQLRRSVAGFTLPDFATGTGLISRPGAQKISSPRPAGRPSDTASKDKNKVARG